MYSYFFIILLTQLSLIVVTFALAGNLYHMMGF